VLRVFWSALFQLCEHFHGYRRRFTSIVFSEPRESQKQETARGNTERYALVTCTRFFCTYIVQAEIDAYRAARSVWYFSRSLCP